MLGSAIDRCLHDYTVAARIRAIDGVRLEDSPFACWPPILRKLGEAIAGVFRGMLLPGRIFEPDCVRILKIRTLDGRKKFLDGVTRRVVAEVVSDPCEYNRGNDADDNQLSATA